MKKKTSTRHKVAYPMFPFYTPWKNQKTKRFSGVFREYRMGTLAVIGFIVVNDLLQQLFYMKV